MIITIDGPSGAGTTTTAKQVADSRNCVWFSAGGDFRALAYEVIQRKLAQVKNDKWAGDDNAITTLSDEAKINHDGHGTVTVDGKDVTPFLDLPEVTAMVAHISQIPQVRAVHNERMRQFASQHNNNVVFEGRRPGHVFPEAVKFYLEVDEDVAIKRVTEQRGHDVALHNQRRNKMDAERTVEPMKPAPDATIIDTTHLPYGEAAEKILEAIGEKATTETIN